MTVLDCFNLIQNINFPTHTQGHTLDLVCTSGLNNISISGLAIPISDHKLLTLICSAKCTDNMTISYRHVNAVDISTFSASVASSAVPEVLDFTCPSMIYDMY